MIDGAPSRDRRMRMPVIFAVAVLGAILSGASFAPSVLGADPVPAAPVIGYRLSLLRSGDFTHQYTRYQCVGASLQIMRNMIWTTNNRGPTLQKRLWNLARVNSRYRADGGADPYGWAAATALAGHGRYVLIGAPTMAAALIVAAKGMATTGRPAGIIVWHGTHAWVMTGFEATADPRSTVDFKVLTVRIADPLWPARQVGSHRIYAPGTRFRMATLSKNYTAYHDARRDERIEGRFVVIVPLAADAPVPDNAWDPISMSTPITLPQPTTRPPAEPRPTPSPAAEPTPSA